LQLSLSDIHYIFYIPQAAKGGEDAFFANCDAGGVFAIADGVSGYAHLCCNKLFLNTKEVLQ